MQAGISNSGTAALGSSKSDYPRVHRQSNSILKPEQKYFAI